MVAHADVQGDHTEGRGGSSGTDRNKGLANAKRFGVVGAYDGHRASVGRVVVDSTWHHWFDVNLTGRPTDGGDQVDPVGAGDPKAQGFLFNAVGQAALARIQNYFRNVALWTASPARQQCMFTHALWGAVVRYPLNEQMTLDTPIWDLGLTAYDAIGRRAGQCVIYDWVWHFFPVDITEVFKPLPDPCLTCPPFEMVEIFTLGGVVREMLALAYAARGAKAKPVDEKGLGDAVAKGIRSGLSELFMRQKESIAQAPNHLEKLSQVLRHLPKAEAFMHKNEPPPGNGGGKRKAAGKRSKSG